MGRCRVTFIVDIKTKVGELMFDLDSLKIRADDPDDVLGDNGEILSVQEVIEKFGYSDDCLWEAGISFFLDDEDLTTDAVTIAYRNR